VAFTQDAAGGWLHTMPAHGSPLHTPLVHPLGHGVSVDGYVVHEPLLHAPGAE
jgi:hypothetical protein